MIWNKMEYYNLFFAVFYLWRLAITTLDKQSCFYYNICGFSAEWQIEYNFNPNELFYLMIIGLSGKRYIRK